MNKEVFWDVTPCRCGVNRRFFILAGSGLDVMLDFYERDFERSGSINSNNLTS
jgi:hypothetical protein